MTLSLTVEARTNVQKKKLCVYKFSKLEVFCACQRYTTEPSEKSKQDKLSKGTHKQTNKQATTTATTSKNKKKRTTYHHGQQQQQR